MFDVGIWEVGLILLLSLIIVGPKRLPEVASKFGQWAGKFRKLQNSLHHIYNHYSDYPNAGKHRLGLDSKSENSNNFEAIQKEINEIKNEIQTPISDLNSLNDMNQPYDSKSLKTK